MSSRLLTACWLLVLLGSCGRRQSSTPYIFMDVCNRPVRVDFPLFANDGAPADSSVLALRIVSVSEPRESPPPATAVLMQDSIPVMEALADGTGMVYLRAPAGRYRLEIRALGYQRTWRHIELESGVVYAPVEVPVWLQPIC